MFSNILDRRPDLIIDRVRGKFALFRIADQPGQQLYEDRNAVKTDPAGKGIQNLFQFRKQRGDFLQLLQLQPQDRRSILFRSDTRCPQRNKTLKN